MKHYGLYLIIVTKAKHSYQVETRLAVVATSEDEALAFAKEENPHVFDGPCHNTCVPLVSRSMMINAELQSKPRHTLP